jgi:hypothetical protein
MEREDVVDLMEELFAACATKDWDKAGELSKQVADMYGEQGYNDGIDMGLCAMVALQHNRGHIELHTPEIGSALMRMAFGLGRVFEADGEELNPSLTDSDTPDFGGSFDLEELEH